MIIKDRRHLIHNNWDYIVMDEGHRLKNLNCKLMKEIKQYKDCKDDFDGDAAFFLIL